VYQLREVIEKMVGPCRFEPQISTVSTRSLQVLTTTYKAVGDCQVLDNTPWLDPRRIGCPRGLERLGRFQGGGSLCDHLAAHVWCSRWSAPAYPIELQAR
jgi:hypothetical protein